MPTTQQSPNELVNWEPLSEPELSASRTGASSDAPRPRTGVALVEGSVASLAAETQPLRRRRLLAAAAFLAAAYGLLLGWVLLSDNPGTNTADGSRFSIRAGILALQSLLSAAVAGLLASKVGLTQRQVRVAEYVLFLGLTLLVMASQYFFGIDLMHRGVQYMPVILAFIKDGLIQMIVLMMIYGTIIPNPPTIAVRALAAMFIGPVATLFVLRVHPDAARVVAQLRAAEDAGANILYLAIAALLATAGSYLLSGLRTDLHEARKFGQYRLLRKIGSGGMGDVYLAEHSLLKRPCALKLIRPEAGTDANALARFEREVQSTARLAHHNTIAIYDYGHTNDGTFYYVMEYLRGMSLADIIRNDGPLPAGRVIFLFRQVCAGLAEAHDKGLVHRDLKPANLFVAMHGGEADVAKVLDFGLVKVTKDPGAATLTAEMTVSGTPLYMAPEQAMADRTLDARADIYALGAMMYAALTGRPPFFGDSPFAVMMAHARDPVIPPATVRPGVPEDLETVVLRCLAKKREERFPTVRALSEALAACKSASEWGPNRSQAWWASVDLHDFEAEPGDGSS
jgi:serine/threonine-protein kinase